ncbi:MAG: diacylglycerol kinase (ATP) [Enterobacterales bacterium]|jgi:diacylglycerol kinase (ATP)
MDNKEEINDNADTFKGKSGLARIINAMGYSLAGLKAAFTSEAAFRQLVMLNVILIPIAAYIDVSRVERVLLIGSVFITLIIELLNSAIEATVDRISLSLHPLSKQAKDMGSAAQMLGLALVSLTWLLILY